MNHLWWAGWFAWAAMAVATGTEPPAPVRGRVVDPAGRVVAGAQVSLRSDAPDLPAGPSARSGADGRFELVLTPEWQASREPRPRATLAATAPGFGVGWVGFDPARLDTEVRLVTEGPAIEGRILDKDGQPVAGARVVVRTIVAPRLATPAEPPAAALDRFLATPDGQVDPDRLDRVAVAILAPTGGNGRFTLRGIGPDRIARIEVSGPAIATTEVDAMTRDRPVLGLMRHGRNGWDTYPLRPDRFDLEVWPARIIAGTARDAATGQPLAGWRVAASFYDFNNHDNRVAEAATDADGRYRVAGLQPSPFYHLRFTPPPGQPYLTATLAAPEGPRVNQPADLAPAPGPFDVAFRRAVIVRGRVTDRATGRPVAGQVSVVRYPGDPPLADHPDFAGDEQPPQPVGADGRYEVMAPPGRTVLAFAADPVDRYQIGRGAELLPGFNPANPTFRAANLTATRRTSDFNALGVLEIPLGDRTAGLDLELDAAESVELTVLDPAGEPLGDVEVQGVGGKSLGRVQHVESPRMELLGFPADHWRRVSVWHLGRQLAGSIVVAAAAGPRQTIRLAPWGEARGRVVGPAGAPRGDLPLVAGPIFARAPRPEPFASLALIPVRGQLETDPAGRFHLAGLVPGMHYGLSIPVAGSALDGDLVIDLAVGPGEVKDLGDVAARRPAPPPRP